MYVDPNRNRNASNLCWLMPYCRPELPRVIGAQILYLVSAAMALVTPLIAARIVDRVIELTIIRVGRAIRLPDVDGTRFGQNSVYRLVSDEYEKLHELDFTYFNHTRTGDIMSRMTSDTDAIRHCLSWVSYQIARLRGHVRGRPVRDVRHRLATRARRWPASRRSFSCSRAACLTHAHPLFFAIRNSLASLNSMVEENIEGNRVVKAFVREPYETEKFDEHNDDYMQRNMALAYNSASTCRGWTASASRCSSSRSASADSWSSRAT
jgi:ATP-binding cassette subfamily B multidrug efflux pump